MNSIIIYTTKYGSVEKVAEMLKSKLNGTVRLVNLTKDQAPNLSEFDTVILGGSIYVGKVQKTLTNYISANLPMLLQKRVGLFICAAQPEPVRSQELEQAYPVDLFNHALAKEVFGHEFNFQKLSFIHKIIVRKLVGVSETVSELSEEKIEQFAKALS